MKGQGEREERKLKGRKEDTRKRGKEITSSGSSISMGLAEGLSWILGHTPGLRGDTFIWKGFPTLELSFVSFYANQFSRAVHSFWKWLGGFGVLGWS